MGRILKKSIIVSLLSLFFASWLGIAVRSIAHDKGATEIDQESVEFLDDSMIEHMARKSKLQENLAQERVLLRRDFQDFAVEDAQDNLNHSSTTLNPLGTRRMWFYSILMAAHTYYGLLTNRGASQSESWPVESLKLAHPIDASHGPLLKNFQRAVDVFKEVMDLKLSENTTLELSTSHVNTILKSDGHMWGIPWPGTEKILVMNGNGRVAGLQWACLSECFRDEARLTVKVQVHAWRTEVGKINYLLSHLMNGLYTCSDLAAHYKMLVDYWRTGAGCREPAFGACAKGQDVVSSPAKAWTTAEPCMERFAAAVNNTILARSGTVTLPNCDWPGLMRLLKKPEYKAFVDLYSSWVRTGRPEGIGAYKVDCVHAHARECESRGMKDSRDLYP